MTEIKDFVKGERVKDDFCKSVYSKKVFTNAGHISRCIGCLSTWKAINRKRKLRPLKCQLKREWEGE